MLQSSVNEDLSISHLSQGEKQADTMCQTLPNITCGLTWPVWFSGLGVVPQSVRLLGQFPVRAQAWVAGLVPRWGTCEKQPIEVFLHLLSPLSKNQ